jgi:N-acetylglucosaminyldiphosphoundecaprenol N-acetyl-beta-D-mannosaminyltransferase
MGVGGGIDIIAQITKRAPMWMQRTGLEWFYRIVQEPRRMWKRYLTTNTAFAALLAREVLKRVFEREMSAPSTTTSSKR